MSNLCTPVDPAIDDNPPNVTVDTAGAGGGAFDSTGVRLTCAGQEGGCMFLDAGFDGN